MTFFATSPAWSSRLALGWGIRRYWLAVAMATLDGHYSGYGSAHCSVNWGQMLFPCHMLDHCRNTRAWWHRSQNFFGSLVALLSQAVGDDWAFGFCWQVGRVYGSLETVYKLGEAFAFTLFYGRPRGWLSDYPASGTDGFPSCASCSRDFWGSHVLGLCLRSDHCWVSAH